VALCPPHLHYVEPYFGGGAVLLAKDPNGVSEVVNDLNGELTNFWSVLKDKTLFEEFRRMAEATPFSEVAYKACVEFGSDTVEDGSIAFINRAWRFFVACRQSLAGRMKGFTGITKTRTRRGMNNEVSAWLTAIEGLPAVHERLKRVLILNRPALDVIKEQDGKDTLFYIDAPYVHSTRTTTKEYGKFEMTDDEHKELIECLLCLKGKAMVSMYHHQIYDILHTKHGWSLHEFSLPNNAAAGQKKRRMTECLWLNPQCSIGK
jgi:DNA adenine methylase